MSDKVPHWAASAHTHRLRSKCHFKLYSPIELARMTEEEWAEECRRNGVPTTDDTDEIVRDLIAQHKEQKDGY
jgi:hypothetical protein